jgi:hypothetical protein
VFDTTKDKRAGLFAGYYGGAYGDRLKYLNTLDFTKPNDVNGTRCVDVIIAQELFNEKMNDEGSKFISKVNFTKEIYQDKEDGPINLLTSIQDKESQLLTDPEVSLLANRDRDNL